MREQATGIHPVRAQVAIACRFLSLCGFEDLTLGHVSSRDADPETVYIKRKGPALSEVRPDDVVPLRLDDPEALNGPSMHLEAVLHTEVYRIRSDVGAVIHAHPWFATALAGTSADVEFITHDAVLFSEGVAVFDETPEMITDPAQGVAVAKRLGGCRALLLRNHGMLVVGEDVRWAVLAAVTLERAVRLQAIASGLGPLEPIRTDLVDRVFEKKYQAQFLDDYWPLWERAVRLAERRGDLPPWEAPTA